MKTKKGRKVNKIIRIDVCGEDQWFGIISQTERILNIQKSNEVLKQMYDKGLIEKHWFDMYILGNNLKILNITKELG